MAEGDTLLNAAIGAAVSIVLSFLPFAAVLGGAVAGYLQVREQDVGEGARVGAISGLIALVPVVLLLFAIGSFLPFLPLEVGAFTTIALVVVLVVATLYMVAAGAVGGAIGAYLVDEF
ncbi:DUF5518 domain-containing protein [Halorarius litoreus]|uniref:DUF5518 domain-containing protein n=1 Tax=Halorarius litoreus TaxID=2962676 RepID=UPI0020CE7726|nr:DUF5518 domain-containing protein [Halorarius litoreus]